MKQAFHAKAGTSSVRLAVALLAALALAACSQKSEHAEEAAAGHAEPGHAEVSSSAGLPDGRIVAGKELAHTKRDVTGQSCIDCHGPDGNDPIDPSYPVIAGQYSDYLAHALQAYRSGAREQALMTAQAQDLTDQQIADLAAYFGSRQGKLVDLSNVE